MLTEREKKRRKKAKREKELLQQKEKKQRAKENKKNKICRIAIKLFLEKGFEETLISDITRQAKVAYGTFYTFFEKKEDVIHYFLNLEAGNY